MFVFHSFPFPSLERCLHFLRQSWKYVCSSMFAHFTQSALMGLSRVGNAEAIMQTCVKQHFHIEDNIAVEIAQTKAITWTSLNCFCKMLSSWINSFAASSSCNVYWPLSQIAKFDSQCCKAFLAPAFQRHQMSITHCLVITYLKYHMNATSPCILKKNSSQFMSQLFANQPLESTILFH